MSDYVSGQVAEPLSSVYTGSHVQNFHFLPFLFYFRFLEIKKKEIDDYVIVRESVISNIKNLCKVVNQKMLLDSLHETRICDQLLVPDPQQGMFPCTYMGANQELKSLFTCDLAGFRIKFFDFADRRRE